MAPLSIFAAISPRRHMLTAAVTRFDAASFSRHAFAAE